MQLNLAKEALDDQINRARALRRFLDCPSFTLIFQRADEHAQYVVCRLIRECNFLGIREWFDQQLLEQEAYNHMSLRALRQLAANRRIPEYQSQNKDDLVKVLT